jgi:putative FmdB family regulatory protein
LEALVPIYEYRCSACAFQKEYLQKVSDPLLSVCPECGKESFGKMLTAAGFQLKGGGWYATDFKHSGSKPGAKTAGQGTGTSQSEGKSATAVEGKSESITATPPVAAPATTASAAKAE